MVDERGLGGERRAGCLDSYEAAVAAAESARVEVLEYLLAVEPGLVQEPLLVWVAGGPEDRVACLEFLKRAGCQWSDDGGEVVLCLRDVLRCFDTALGGYRFGAGTLL